MENTTLPPLSTVLRDQPAKLQPMEFFEQLREADERKKILVEMIRKAIAGPKDDRSLIKKNLKRLEKADFGPLMGVSYPIRPGALFFQPKGGKTTGQEVIRWVYKCNESKNIAAIERFLGLPSLPQFSRTWTYERAAAVTAEALYSVLVRVPDLLANRKALPPDADAHAIHLASALLVVEVFANDKKGKKP